MTTLRYLALSLPALIAMGLSGCGSDSGVNPIQVPAQDASAEDAASQDNSAEVQPGDAQPDKEAAASDADAQPEAEAGPSFLLPGLGAPVTIVVDKNGIKHIQCKTDEDCYAALGYVHARDRFFYMDVQRNYLRAKTAELPFEYPTLLQEVLDYRHFLTARDGRYLEEVVWEKLSASTKALVDAYSRGVNAWLVDFRAGNQSTRIAEEAALLASDYGTAVKDWEALDTIAVFLGEGQGETASLAPDLSLAQLKPLLPIAVFQDLLMTPSALLEPIVPVTTPTSVDLSVMLKHGQAIEKASLQSKAWQGVHATAAGHLHALRRATEYLGRPQASNNWAVGQSLVEPNSSFKALAANDPHGAIRFPTHMYPVEIDSKTNGTGTLHVTGDTMAGAPFFQLGHTDTVAWGLTTSLIDGVDYYEEELTPDGKSVVFKGQNVALLEKTWELTTYSGSSKTFTVRWVPHHGPVVAYDAAKGKAISARWIGHEGPLDADGMFALMRAQNIEEALTAVRKISALGNNFAMADSAGRVAWRPAALIPKRPWASEHPPYMPLPGDGTAEWDGFLGAGEHPELLDPAQGWVATANNEFHGVWYDGDPTNEGKYMQDRPYNNFRARRIRELMDASTGHHTRETMSQMQHDTYLWYAAKLLPTVLADAQARWADLDDSGRRLFEALKDWKYTCPTGLQGTEPTSPPVADAAVAKEAIGCTAFHVVGADGSYGLMKPHFDAAGLKSSPGVIQTDILYMAVLEPKRLAMGESIWDDPSTPATETRSDRIVAVFNSSGARLSKKLGTDIDKWRWGQALSLSPTPALIQTTEIGGLGPYAVPGGMESVGVLAAIPIDTTGSGLWHAAMVRKVDVLGATESEEWIEFPGGTEAYPSSPYYKNLLQNYLEQKPTRVPTNAAQLAPEIAETFLLVSTP